MFLVDVSVSNIHYYRLTLEFIRNVVQGLDLISGATKIAYLTFNDRTRVVFNFNDMPRKREDLMERLYLHYFGGAAYLPGAVRTVTQNLLSDNWGDRASVQNAVVLISDGNLYWPDGYSRTQIEVDQLKRTNTDLFAVGLGPDANQEVLGKFIGQSGASFLVQTEAEAEDTAVGLLDVLCTWLL